MSRVPTQKVTSHIEYDTTNTIGRIPYISDDYISIHFSPRYSMYEWYDDSIQYDTELFFESSDTDEEEFEGVTYKIVKPYKDIYLNWGEIVVEFYTEPMLPGNYGGRLQLRNAKSMHVVKETLFKVKHNGNAYEKIKLNGSIVTPK